MPRPSATSRPVPRAQRCSHGTGCSDAGLLLEVSFPLDCPPPSKRGARRRAPAGGRLGVSGKPELTKGFLHRRRCQLCRSKQRRAVSMRRTDRRRCRSRHWLGPLSHLDQIQGETDQVLVFYRVRCLGLGSCWTERLGVFLIGKQNVGTNY